MDQLDVDGFLENLAKIDEDPLLRESDRGCVLMRVADLDNRIEAVLVDWFTGASGLPSRMRKRLFDFTGPLGTFSSRILVARSMGLLSEELHRDLESLRTLRNSAAHSSDAFTLSSPEARASMSRMHYEFRKSGRLKRYSITSSANPDVDVNPSETFMKGRGYLRFDKVNFILTVAAVELELVKLRAVSSSLGTAATHSRDCLLKDLRTRLERNECEP